MSRGEYCEKTHQDNKSHFPEQTAKQNSQTNHVNDLCLAEDVTLQPPKDGTTNSGTN